MRANVIIFSKDRAAQVHACVRSLIANCADKLGEDYSISVLYKASTEDFMNGYEICKSSLEHESIEWKLQRHDMSFRKDLKMLFNGREANPLTMFLVDDILFRDRFSFFDPEIETLMDSNALLACSLRLDKNITECYATNSPSAVPAFVKACVWNWYGAQGDWGYPYSVDGNVYRTGTVIKKILNSDFANPNQFEASLNVNNASLVGLGTEEKPTYMICYVNGSKLVNIPANRVQDEYANRVASIMSPEEMNVHFCEKGEQISLSTVSDLKNSTVHVEIPIVWEKRN